MGQKVMRPYQIRKKNLDSPEYIQTSPEISFLGSPKDSIFYSIARFFLSECNTVLPLLSSGK